MSRPQTTWCSASATLVALTTMGLTGCGQPDGRSDVDSVQRTEHELQSIPKITEEPAQPINTIFRAEMVDGETIYHPPQDLPDSAYDMTPFEYSAQDLQRKVFLPLQPSERIAPSLLADVRGLEAGTVSNRTVEVVVTFVQDFKVPRFPEGNQLEPRDSPGNRAVRERADDLVTAIREARTPRYDALMKAIGPRYGVVEKERFWLINGILLDMPLRSVRGLAAHGDVQHVDYNQTDVPPPHVADRIVAGRNLIRSEPYFNGSSPWLGLLDSGVRKSHVVFTNPARVSIWRDCVNGTSGNCSVGNNLNPDDDCPNGGHGTATANVLSGNENTPTYTTDSRGVTKITLDSWKVYSGCGFNSAAGVRAFQSAVQFSDHTIIAEIQAIQPFDGAISTAADAAFDAGALVVSAAGNFATGSSDGSVRAPGNAHKALAVGAIDVQTQVLESYSGRGPTVDGRIKPDLTAPTNVHAAANTSDTAVRAQLFSGTSGATPFAAGATALVRNWMKGTNSTIDPGQVYAYMILSGQLWGSLINNDHGAGLVKLPAGGGAAWGAVTVAWKQTVEIPLELASAPTSHVSGAIWWPEGTSAHNDIDLGFNRPNGTVGSTSVSGPSVFERVHVTTGLAAGTWKLRIHGHTVGATSQKVYWALWHL